jgi:hypothetical protein
VFHGNLDLAAEAAMLPFDAAETADHQIVKLFIDALGYETAALNYLSLARSARSVDEFASEAEPVLWKINERERVVSEFRYPRGSGNNRIGRADQSRSSSVIVPSFSTSFTRSWIIFPGNP